MKTDKSSAAESGDLTTANRIVITGATGMIALALIRYFLRQENCPEIYCVTRPNSKRTGDIPKDPAVHIIECDLNNLEQLPFLIQSPCDVFYHFAWEGTFGDSRDNTMGQTNNIRCTLHAVQAAKILGCHSFIGAGSQAEYGRSSSKLTPDSPVNPDTAYGICKYTAGKLSRLQCRDLGMRHIWARILSVYGPYDGENTMIMSCIRSFLKNEKLPLTKGEQIWDYLHCDDAARALCLMAEKGIDGAVYPLGSGIGRPLSEYILTIRDIISPALQPGIGDREYSDKQVMYLCADITSLARDTGFEPEIAFEDGIRSTAAWFAANQK